ncbi:MAG: glycosyltransferase family 4 protein [Terrimicrobiaceae bacterium]
MSSGIVIFLPGHLNGFGGGGNNYAISHGRVAQRLGCDVHYFYHTDDPAGSSSDFGVLHPLRSKTKVCHFDLPELTDELERAVIDFVVSLPAQKSRPAVLIHAFGPWSFTAHQIVLALRTRGIPAAAVASSFAGYVQEKWSQLMGSLHYSPKNTIHLLSILAKAVFHIHPREAKGYRNAGLVLVNYDKIKRDLQTTFGKSLRFRKITYCPASAFLPQLPEPIAASLLPPGTAPLIVVVSRHDSRKGIDVMLKALHKLKNDGHPFRVILLGTGPLWNENRLLAKRLGLADAAFPGFVEDTLAYLRAADIFVLPSRAEQSGSVSLLEAFQCGVASVCSACDGIPEDIKDGENGLLAHPGDHRDLANKIAVLLEDAELRKRLGEAGHTTFQSRFSGEAMTHDLGEVYAELLREIA